jgi:hypothetical protein
MTDHGSSRDSRSLAFRVRRATPTLDFAKWWASGESKCGPAPTRSFLAVSVSWLGAGIALGAAGCIGGPGVRVGGAGATGMRACGPAGGLTGGADDPPWTAGVRPPGWSGRTWPWVVPGCPGGGCGRRTCVVPGCPGGGCGRRTWVVPGCPGGGCEPRTCVVPAAAKPAAAAALGPAGAPCCALGCAPGWAPG